MRDPDEGGIRRYLLGLTAEPEAEALEEAYFARPELLDRMRAVEDDLLDDYAAGRLGPAERQAFETRYLAAGPLRERVVAARALRLSAADAGRGTRAGAAAPRPGRWSGTLALAAVLLLVVMASWLWRLRAPERMAASAPPPSVVARETPMPVATPSPAAPTNPRAPAARVVFALSPVLLRGEGGPPELRIPDGVDTVVLELEGEPSGVPAPRLEVTIETVEGRRAFRGPARRPGAGRLPRVASVSVPADRLAPGDYLVTLTAGGQTLYRYFLRVAGR